MKLVCLDFSNFIIRHASNPYNTVVDQGDRPVGGVVGAINHGLRLINQEHPTHLLIARDGSRKDNFRRNIDSDYKAHRQDIDSDLVHQFNIAYQAIDILQWPSLAVDSYEADDIIASAARAFPGETLIVSGDRDLLALCSDDITVRLLKPGGQQNCQSEECKQIFGVGPEQLCDYKALVGDASDGIPGVAGIGPKKAVALLEEHQTLQNIIIELENQSGAITGVNERVSNILRQNINEAEKSYNLAKLIDDLSIDIDSLLCPDMVHVEQIGEQFNALGLNPLLKLFPGGERYQEPEVDMATAFSRALRQN